MNKKQVSYFAQVAIVLAGLIAVIGLAQCMTGRPFDAQPAMDSFAGSMDALRAYERAVRVCQDCAEEIKRADEYHGSGGMLPLVNPCLVECFDATEAAAQGAKRIAEQLQDAGL